MTHEDAQGWVKLFFNFLVLIFAFVAALLTNSWLKPKREYEHMTLSDYSLPLIRPSIKINDPIDNAQGPVEFCTISGLYEVINDGKMPWMINDIWVDFYELPPVTAQDLEGEKKLSRTWSNYTKHNDPTFSDLIEDPLIVGPGGKGSRYFEIVFAMKKLEVGPRAEMDDLRKMRYFLVHAYAKGGRLELNNTKDQWWRWWKSDCPDQDDATIPIVDKPSDQKNLA